MTTPTLALADEIADWLAPHALRVAVAGSVRRGKPDPKDIEIVVVPDETYHAFTDTLVGNGGLWPQPLPTGAVGRPIFPDPVVRRWGSAYRRLLVDDVVVELFTATPATWGYIYWLRTGPGDANAWVMSVRERMGWDWCARGGAVRHLDGTPRPVPDETTMFALMGMPYIPPEDRTVARYRAAAVPAQPQTPRTPRPAAPGPRVASRWRRPGPPAVNATPDAAPPPEIVAVRVTARGTHLPYTAKTLARRAAQGGDLPPWYNSHEKGKDQ